MKPHPVAVRLFAAVTAVFLVIIAVWVVVIRLAAEVDTRRLTPVEEAAVLAGRKSQ